MRKKLALGIPVLSALFLGVFPFFTPGAGGARVATASSQEIQHATGVVNVEVPVRVFDGQTFVDNLALDDFVVLEDGRPQSVAALHLIRNSEVQKSEGPGTGAGIRVRPMTQRNIVLLFQVDDPMPKLDQAIDYFFDQVCLPGDRVSVVTPVKSYHLKPNTLSPASRSDVGRQLKGRLRKDILAGSMGYKSLIRSIRDMERLPVEEDVKEKLVMDLVRQLRDRLTVEDSRLRQVAAALKAREGQKHVFVFLQRERVFLPALSDQSMAELYENLSFDSKVIEQIFADASLVIHFIYLTQMMPHPFESREIGSRGEETLFGSKDLTQNIYAAFREMSQVTGGLTEATGNPLAAFKKAVMASENYYLLYYVPKDYKADGKFHEIKVTVKGKRYRVTHRAGYFAN